MRCFLCDEPIVFGELHEHGPKRVDRLLERIMKECPALLEEIES